MFGLQANADVLTSKLLAELIFKLALPSQTAPVAVEAILGCAGIAGAALITDVVAELTQPAAFCTITP